MSDQAVHDAGPKWDVDWSSAGTWWKFVGLCVLIALMLVAGNMIVVGAVRLIATAMPEAWLGGPFSPDDPGADLPMAIVAASFAAYLLGLVCVINRWAARFAGQ